MANHTTFFIFMALVPILVVPLWVVSPLFMVIAIFLEVAAYWLFTEKLLYYKVVAK